ncbi:riboflavin synthase [Limibaculum sp. M0105]|uniref:Riboflavin synthase n=1 Tax=Thermohalobaculum xanthum TaxID=2753746 RepID=A0A8J7M629_9RHOB|nr:riboflavin synthase [Thermohalobaculum xanthum]MBK0398385.1 riboflavin synthase [Thermohalobaculum xanthum]
MFTGIVREVGRVLAVSEVGDTRLEIACARPAGQIEIGASIACNGICLTVVEKGQREGQNWFAVEASAETRARTTLGTWKAGDAVNLEPALRVGDELGGHIVSGHVDGLGRIVAIRPEGASHRVTIEAPAALAKFLAEKGSIAVDGISLTINEVDGSRFGVNIIPHTWEVTSLKGKGVGSDVNLEADLMARYVARLREAG